MRDLIFHSCKYTPHSLCSIFHQTENFTPQCLESCLHRCEQNLGKVDIHKRNRRRNETKRNEATNSVSNIQVSLFADLSGTV